MEYIVIGNIMSLISNILALISTSVKSYKKMMVLQSMDTAFSTLTNLILGGYSGALISFCSLIRNIYCIFSSKINKIISYCIIIVSFFVSFLFTFHVWYDLLPIIASTFYGFVIINTKDIVKSKIALLINCALWLIYGCIIFNFMGVVFKSIMVVSCINSLYQLKKSSISVL